MLEVKETGRTKIHSPHTPSAPPHQRFSPRPHYSSKTTDPLAASVVTSARTRVPTAHADFDPVAKRLRGALDTAAVEPKMRQPAGTRSDADEPEARRSDSRLPVGLWVFKWCVDRWITGTRQSKSWSAPSGAVKVT
jgi:hypothetical protein